MKFIKGKLLSIEKENDKYLMKIKEKSNKEILTFYTEDIKDGTDLELIIDDKNSKIIIIKNLGRSILPLNIFMVYFILLFKSMFSTMLYCLIFVPIIIFAMLDTTEIINIESFFMSLIEFIILFGEFVYESFSIKILIISYPIIMFFIHFFFNIIKIIKGKKNGSLFIGNVKGLSLIKKIFTVWDYFL